MKSILVVFGEKLPGKNKKWLRQFDEVLSSEKLACLIKPGSVREGYNLLRNLANLKLVDGSRLAKSVNYRGYELWWMHYESLYDKFTLPYTQYCDLLKYLKNYENICFVNPPYPYLFKYFLEAHGCNFSIFQSFYLKNFLPLPAGVLIQVFLSFLFLPWLIVKRAKLMVWTSDKFSPPRDHDFRMGFIYDELRKRKINFIEFVRSLESWHVVLQHALQRKRPVFYSVAVTMFIYSLTKLINRRDKIPQPAPSLSREETFWFLTATHYLRDVTAVIWSINFIKFILRFLGIKTAIIAVAVTRTFHEVLGCKLAGIKTVGIQHGAQILEYCTYDFLPDFDGEKQMSVDRYGVWSDWWKDYYLTSGNAYKESQLAVSGPMRPLLKPLEKSNIYVAGDLPKVVFIAEQLAVLEEVIPYLETLLDSSEIILYLKFRPYRDGFELWLKEKAPVIYEKILDKAKVLRGSMEEAVGVGDVVVGSHSTAVLEAFLQLKPPVFFRTQKWGDYFSMKSLDSRGKFFAENPQELISRLKEAPQISREELAVLQKRFFGNPFQNGSAWVVDEVEKNLGQLKR